MTTTNDVVADEIVSKLRTEWGVAEQNPIEHHMGLGIQRDTSRVRISAKKRIELLLDTFGMRDCNSCRLPHDPSAELSSAKQDEELISASDQKLHSHAVSLARFVTDKVIYEIGHITSVLARSLPSSTSRHCAALKRLLRYLAGRTDAHIYFKCASGSALIAFCHSDLGCAS